jgi:uncharacterized membrane protein
MISTQLNISRGTTVKTAKSAVRAIASTILLLSIFLLAFSGIFMHALGHEDSLSASILGYTRDGWLHVHALVSLLFIISAVIHLRYNWKAYKNHFTIKHDSA